MFVHVIISLMAFFLPYNSREEGIVVSIDNLRSNKGHVLISLFKDGEGYPDETSKAVRKAKLVIKDEKAWVKFTGLSTGKYAIAILHDENDDQKMNKTFLGLPKEGYGFSNNVMGTFGPPSFSKASFIYNSTGSGTSIAIRTRY